MWFYRRQAATPARLGILPGSFNPPTIAHLQLAEAAAPYVDELLWVVPSVFPHKDYFGATLEERLELLGRIETAIPTAVAATEGGLFLDIARECRFSYGPETRLYFLCGRDAAERILTWDYGRPGVVEDMLGEFELLVAPRSGRIEVPEPFRGRIHRLEGAPPLDRVSSTDVRERIQRGEPWEHLVPGGIVERVREIYS